MNENKDLPSSFRILALTLSMVLMVLEDLTLRAIVFSMRVLTQSPSHSVLMFDWGRGDVWHDLSTVIAVTVKVQSLSS